MAEIPPAPEVQINGGGTIPLNPNPNSNPNPNPNPYEPIVSKRQRRPSVRLGEIGGDQTYDSNQPRRTTTTKHWRLPSFHHHQQHRKDPSGKPSKTRPLTNLTEFGETPEGYDRDGNNMDSVVIGTWKVKDSNKKRGGTKRVRSNWVSRIEEDGSGDKFSGGEDVEDGLKDFDVENSEKEQSPLDSLGDFHGGSSRRSVRVRVSEGREREREREQLDGVEYSGPSDNGNGEDGVKVWLNGLGLGRYAPVFEIHEVDDEVLPFLTLEDLKDMGINAVGSRRKMYSAIQKLGKGFS